MARYDNDGVFEEEVSGLINTGLDVLCEGWIETLDVAEAEFEVSIESDTEGLVVELGTALYDNEAVLDGVAFNDNDAVGVGEASYSRETVIDGV